MIEKRPMSGTVTVSNDGHIVFAPGRGVPSGDGRAVTKPVVPPEESRRQLGIINELLKTARPGGIMRRALLESQRFHTANHGRDEVAAADFAQFLLLAARQRKCYEDASEHTAMAGELMHGLKLFYQGEIDLTKSERQAIRAGVQWNLTQAKG